MVSILDRLVNILEEILQEILSGCMVNNLKDIILISDILKKLFD